MKLIIRLMGSLFIFICMALVLILIILLPRDIDVHRVGVNDVMSYHFTWPAYQHNIIDYFKNVKIHKSLGETVSHQPVEKELALYGYRSLVILIPAFFISFILGIYKGVFDYRHKKGVWKILGEGSTWVGQSMPDFFIIIIIEAILGYVIHTFFPNFKLYGYDRWYFTLMPILFLSIYPASIIASNTTQALKEQEEQDYIRTARAKGIPENVILWRHMLPNCMVSILQHFMPICLTIVSSMFLVEYLTLYRAMGTRLIQAIKIKYVLLSSWTSLPIEVPVAICFSLAFLALFLVAQWTSQILKFFLVPVRKENN